MVWATLQSSSWIRLKLDFMYDHSAPPPALTRVPHSPSPHVPPWPKFCCSHTTDNMAFSAWLDFKTLVCVSVDCIFPASELGRAHVPVLIFKTPLAPCWAHGQGLIDTSPRAFSCLLYPSSQSIPYSFVYSDFWSSETTAAGMNQSMLVTRCRHCSRVPVTTAEGRPREAEPQRLVSYR